MPGLKGKIEFRDVEMRYRSDLEPALKNLSFVVNPGEVVAVVGRTGAGKSSLFQLLLGFRDCTAGELLIDDQNVQSLDLNYLRKEINVVLQQPFVSPNETIRRNLNPQNLFSDRQLEYALLDASLIT